VISTTRLKRMVRLRSGGTPSVDGAEFWAEPGEGTPWVSISDMSDGSVVERTDRELTGAGLRDRRLVVAPPGTLLFAMYASVGAVAELGVSAVWNQALLGVEAREGLSDNRFVRYWLEHLRPELAGLVRSNTQDNLNAEQVGNLPFPVKSLADQRAIADYLDTETARIDALITKKRRLIDLLEERFWESVAARITAERGPLAPLRRGLKSITDGPFGSSLTSRHYSVEGARVVRLGNVGFAEFKDEDKAFIPVAHYETLLRHRVRPGDLVIAGLGDSRHHVGRACVAPDLGAAIVKADCYCAEVDQSRADPHFLALVLSSPIGMHSVAIAARGTTRSRINLDIAKEAVVPFPSLSAQRRIVADSDSERKATEFLVDALTRQLLLLQEHRQALITAAVTGKLEIPGAAA